MSENKGETPATRPFVMSSEIKQVYVTGAFGGFNPYDFRLLLYRAKVESATEKFQRGDKVPSVLEITHELILSPLTAKQFLILLGKQVQEYEKRFGEIKLPPPRKAAESR